MLPLLDDVAGRDVVPLLAHRRRCRAATDRLDDERRWWTRPTPPPPAGRPEVVAVLALRQWLRTADPDRHPPDAPPWHG
ncbi:MAG: hypothetical protein R2699_07910 [Acidimicrobiales bacterium]